MDASRLVDNSVELTEAFGSWPSFHDAKVLEATRGQNSLSLVAHLFVMTNRVDEAGYYVLEKHHLVKIEMLGVESDALPSDYSTDCLDRLAISRSGDLLRVDLGSHMGNDGHILCRMVRVASVTPCSPKGVPLAPNNSFKPSPLRGPA